MAENLADELAALDRPIVVLCVGNALRGDDAFGPTVAAKLAHYERLIEGGTAPENELPRIAKMAPRTVLIVDAVHFGGEPGELRLIAPDHLRSDDLSTHAASIETAAAFLRDACGARTAVLAAQPVSVQFGAVMSAPMRDAVRRVIPLLRSILED